MPFAFLRTSAVAIALAAGELPATPTETPPTETPPTETPPTETPPTETPPTETPGGDYRWDPFSPVKRPPVPPVETAAWVRNPIDSFIASAHLARGLRPRPEAPPEVLLRRVYLDLIGLPPSPQEQREFLEDPSPDAYPTVVDRLLESPHYGERWGRHWMDIWRYADRDRKKANDGSKIPPEMWHWRDWIVDSLNQDKGYDRLLQAMLAADELTPADRDNLSATAFLARNQAKSRDVWMHDTVDHTFQAFTGLTIQCARCHDHPVDAITQTEYYQLRAIFEPSGVRSDGFPRIYDANAGSKTWLYVRGNELQPDKENPIPPGVPVLLKGPAFDLESEPPMQGSTGRRRTLARWLCDRNHPLTARVAVNHIWGRHFGRALVPSVNDFGKGGEPPTHPALLDWLAAEFMDRGWSLKQLHRLIVTSATYRLASTPIPRDERVGNQPILDPDNHYLWRYSPRRMEAELVRDSILATSGRLDRTLGGPVLEAERGEEDLRRSLYFRHGPNTQMPLLTTFDGAVAQECYQRSHSVQPQQALALLNSKLVLQSARQLARQLTAKSTPEVNQFVAHAFTIVLARPVTETEARICNDYLAEQKKFFTEHAEANRGATSNLADLKHPSSDPALRARESLLHLLFNHHDFITIK